ncbi:MAG: M23 family metallopeptidase, partial [Planctomycetales bacterium]|nr:M23 family metallopeptidase [Planctomycetales bacterium]
PLRIYFVADDPSKQHYLSTCCAPALLAPRATRTLEIAKSVGRFHMTYGLGTVGDVPPSPRLRLPYSDEAAYCVSQGYDGQFSHQDIRSRYAVDFDMDEGTTIVAAADGVVVGVVDRYEQGAPDPRFKNRGNYIAVYHPSLGVFTEYWHLMHRGSLVKVGDSVRAGQYVAKSGKTGFAQGPHLHFFVWIANDDPELTKRSVPFHFGAMPASELTARTNVNPRDGSVGQCNSEL